MSPGAVDGRPREAIAGVGLHPAPPVLDRKTLRHEGVGHATGPFQHAAVRDRHGKGERFPRCEESGRLGGGMAGTDGLQAPVHLIQFLAQRRARPQRVRFLHERHGPSRRACDTYGSPRDFEQHLLVAPADQRHGTSAHPRRLGGVNGEHYRGDGNEHIPAGPRCHIGHIAAGKPHQHRRKQHNALKAPGSTHQEPRGARVRPTSAHQEPCGARTTAPGAHQNDTSTPIVGRIGSM